MSDSRRRHRIAIGIATAVTVAAATVAVSSGAQAATIFSDDFEDGNSAGWTASGGSWSVVTDGDRAYRQTGTSSDARARAGDPAWRDYTVSADVRPNAFNGTNRFVAVLARAQSNTSYYYVALRSNNTVELKKLVGGSSTTLAAAPLTVAVGTQYRVSLEVRGTALTASVNGTRMVSASDSQFAAGQIGVATFNASADFDNVTVVDTPSSTPTAPTTGTTRPPTTTTRPPSTTTRPPTTTTRPPDPPAGGPIGFASVNALGQNGTTGGAGGPTVSITTAAQLEDYAGRAGPYILMISGTISFDDMITVVANKSIIGVGSTAHITGGGLQLGSTTRPGNNVIIRNIRFTDASDDSVSVTNSAHHVWIDHCDFSTGFDGLLDVKRQSDFVTVSWNHFHDHSKTLLLGHSDTFTADIGHLRVTYHHNFFDGTEQRHPRARFGEPVHVFNNYYRDNGLYGVASTENAGVLVEGNYFLNVAHPIHVGYAESGPGRVVERNNVYVNSGAPETAGTVVEPGTYYSYTLDNPANIPTIVANGVGVGRI
jgi:pectate lyase